MPKGQIAWNKGTKGLFHHSDVTKQKIKLSLRGKTNYLWKGEKVGYLGLHLWVQREKGKAKKCSNCGKEGTGRYMHWANIDHKYRRNKDDFIEMCAKCHRKYDKDNNLTTRY